VWRDEAVAATLEPAARSTDAAFCTIASNYEPIVPLACLIGLKPLDARSESEHCQTHVLISGKSRFHQKVKNRPFS
jgi:hypothetical protein